MEINKKKCGILCYVRGNLKYTEFEKKNKKGKKSMYYKLIKNILQYKIINTQEQT